MCLQDAGHEGGGSTPPKRAMPPLKIKKRLLPPVQIPAFDMYVNAFT